MVQDRASDRDYRGLIPRSHAGEKVTRTCVGATPHRKGMNVEIDCIAVFD